MMREPQGIERSPMKESYDTYQSDSPDALWTNVLIGDGYEIRMDALNRLSVYKVTISYRSIALPTTFYGNTFQEGTRWVVTRIPWATAPTYVHHIREHMRTVLRMLAEREKGDNDLDMKEKT